MRAVLAAHPTIGGSGIAHLSRTSKQRRDLTQIMIFTNRHDTTVPYSDKVYISTQASTVCAFLTEIEIFQISDCQ